MKFVIFSIVWPRHKSKISIDFGSCGKSRFQELEDYGLDELDGLLFIAQVFFGVCNVEFFRKIDLWNAVSFLGRLAASTRNHLIGTWQVPLSFASFYPSQLKELNFYLAFLKYV